MPEEHTENTVRYGNRLYLEKRQMSAKSISGGKIL